MLLFVMKNRVFSGNRVFHQSTLYYEIRSSHDNRFYTDALGISDFSDTAFNLIGLSIMA
jgi:hypothetical protein